MTEYDCPYCDRSFGSKSGRNSHKGQMHDCRTTINCEECGSEFEVKKSRANNARFCSYQCRGDWQSEAFEGEGGPGWDGGQEEYTCNWCEEVFEQHPSQGGTKFCSKDCYWEWFRENAPTGPDHHSWKDGAHYSYGEGWNPQKRREILERDDRECQKCGLKQEEHRQKFDAGLHLHHIVPYRVFDEDAEANRLENLVLLCAECHMETEHSIWKAEEERDVSRSEYRQILGNG